MKSCTGSILPCERPSALTVPLVTVKVKPKGLPKAMTVSPTCRLFESPSGMAGTRRPPRAITAGATHRRAPIALAFDLRLLFTADSDHLAPAVAGVLVG